MHPALETFTVFLRLGLTSFGGPTAHVGIFRHEIVVRRRWMREEEFADTVALCQFLPGPTSSQLGFAIGLRRAGPAGGPAAWLGFTLPSALALGIAGGALAGTGAIVGAGWLAGLRAFAVAVVANALIGMVRTLAPTRMHVALAAALLVALLAAGVASLPAWMAAAAQPLAIGVGAACGAFALGSRTPVHVPAAGDPDDTDARARAFHLPRALSALAALGFLGALALTMLAVGAPPILQAAAACTRAGALVFGGGHVVLPLVQEPFVANEWMPADTVLSGYALAQAVPGPLFTMVAYLGAAMQAQAGPIAAAAGAALLLMAIFLPGLLAVVAVLPAWHRLQAVPGMRAALAGANCAVIAVLGAALVQDVAPAGIKDAGSACIGGACMALLAAPLGMRGGRGAGIPVIAIAAAAAAAGALILG